MYHPIGIEGLYIFQRFYEKKSTTYLKCYFGQGKRTCIGTALIRNEKLVVSTPCPEPHPEVEDVILKTKKRLALQEALKTKPESTTMKEWYQNVEKE